MSTLFDQTSLPLWLWVVIIVVGSLCIIGAIGVVILCMVRRRRTTGSVSEMPTRKMTVRRGRVVPASHYLSLTGSKFGLNQFDDDARTNGTRSKSPFEWWNTIKEKRKSQHDDLSHFEGPEGKAMSQGHYHEPTSPISPTTEKVPMANVQDVQETPTVQRPARVASFSRPFNPPQENPDSPGWTKQAHGRNLSMIKEAASPHTSVILPRTLERRSSRLSGYTPGESTRKERRPSDHYGDSRRPSDSQSYSGRSSGSSRRPSDARPDGQRQTRPRGTSDSRSDAQRPYGSRRQSDARSDGYRSDGYRSDAPRSDRYRSHSDSTRPTPSSSKRTSGRSGPSPRRSRAPPIDTAPPHPQHPEVPRPVAYRGSRHSLGEEAPTVNHSSSTLSKRNSVASRPESLTDREFADLSRRNSRPKSLILDETAAPQDAGYWAPRAEMMPTDASQQPPTPTTPTSTSRGPSRASSIGTSNSRKGNVLRKKSIKRQEVMSYVGA